MENKDPAMKKVMIFGTFDGVHEGHRALFRQASEHGDHLIVVIARDVTVTRVKGRQPFFDEQQRLKDVADEAGVHEAVLGNVDDVYRVVAEHRPDCICLGYDQRNFIDGLREKLNELGLGDTQIVRLEAHEPERYKSSLLKKERRDGGSE